MFKQQKQQANATHKKHKQHLFLGTDRILTTQKNNNNKCINVVSKLHQSGIENADKNQ